jgi:glycerol-3-phosphate acyltransferase PlsX
MFRLVLDAMGGDHGPRVILEGVLQALPELLPCAGELVIIGDEKLILPILNKRRFNPLRTLIQKESHEGFSSFQVRLVHTAETIEMEDSIRAIRSKPNASINLGCQIAARNYLATQKDETLIQVGEVQEKVLPTAFISAGHSGAVMASALVQMGRLNGVERPAIAVKLPTLSQDGCVLIDVGANVDCKPEHLRDFAIMGAMFANAERKNSELPRVALLSNGEERKKGNELTRASATLIENLPCFQPGPEAIGQFLGYTEGKEIFKGQVDVVVTDGFVGNVVLKSVEGLGNAVTHILKSEAKRNPITMLGFLLSAGVFARFKKRLDYAEYGAAPLLGVAGYVFICHGRSNSKAVKSALLRARTSVSQRYIEGLEKALEITARKSS